MIPNKFALGLNQYHFAYGADMQFHNVTGKMALFGQPLVLDKQALDFTVSNVGGSTNDTWHHRVTFGLHKMTYDHDHRAKVVRMVLDYRAEFEMPDELIRDQGETPVSALLALANRTILGSVSVASLVINGRADVVYGGIREYVSGAEPYPNTGSWVPINWKVPVPNMDVTTPLSAEDSAKFKKQLEQEVEDAIHRVLRQYGVKLKDIPRPDIKKAAGNTRTMEF